MQDKDQGEPGWVFRPGDDKPKDEAPGVGILAVAATADNDQREEPNLDLPHIEWTASEYIANPKSAGWFMLLAVGSILLAAGIYFVTKDYVSTGVIALLGVIVGIFAARQPRVLRYVIDNTGIYIGERFYPYATFKTFSVADSQAIHHISLEPLRRFMPPLVIHYDPDDEGKITETLASYLPYQPYRRDIVDSITRRFRF